MIKNGKKVPNDFTNNYGSVRKLRTVYLLLDNKRRLFLIFFNALRHKFQITQRTSMGDFNRLLLRGFPNNNFLKANTGIATT
jgi:hypothetical protein